MEIICKKCGEKKDYSFFVKNSKAKLGIVYTCLDCNKKYRKMFYKKNKTKILQSCKKYRETNKNEILKRKNKYCSSKHGKIVQAINNIKKRCDDPKNKRYERYGGRGIKNFLTYKELSFLWDRDSASNMVKPSLDRIDVNGNYCVENCQFIEMRENSRKDFIKKVRQITKDGKIIKIWNAIVDAEKEGFQRPNIIKCCKGIRSSHKGSKWEYVNQ